MTLEFVDENIQKEYDFLKMEEDDLLSALERIQRRIRQIEEKEECQ